MVALVATALAEDDGYAALAARWGATAYTPSHYKSTDQAHRSNKSHAIRVIPQLKRQIHKPLKQDQLKGPNKQPLRIISGDHFAAKSFGTLPNRARTNMVT